MELHPLKLVTVIVEGVKRDQLCKTGVDLGSTGYTCSEVTGAGSRDRRKDILEGSFRVEFVCPQGVADKIMSHVSHEYFENYACIAWVSDVSVVRGAYYVKK